MAISNGIEQLKGNREGIMRVKRIVANIESRDPSSAGEFYKKILGLDLLMDHGWIRTYGSTEKMGVQVSIASEGGSGTAVPALSIEVDDLGEVLRRIEEQNIPIEYGPVEEPWGVRRLHVRDPGGVLLNVLEHS